MLQILKLKQFKRLILEKLNALIPLIGLNKLSFQGGALYNIQCTIVHTILNTRSFRNSKIIQYKEDRENIQITRKYPD